MDGKGSKGPGEGRDIQSSVSLACYWPVCEGRVVI